MTSEEATFWKLLEDHPHLLESSKADTLIFRTYLDARRKAGAWREAITNLERLFDETKPN